MMLLSTAHLHLQLNGTISWPFPSHAVQVSHQSRFLWSHLLLQVVQHVGGAEARVRIWQCEPYYNADFYADTTNNMACSASLLESMGWFLYRANHQFMNVWPGLVTSPAEPDFYCQFISLRMEGGMKFSVQNPRYLYSQHILHDGWWAQGLSIPC